MVRIPLASSADALLARLARATGSAAIAALDGQTLLGERAMLGGFTIPGRQSAGGGCRLYDAADQAIAINLARPDDRDLLPALFEADDFDVSDEDAIAAQIAGHEVAGLVARGRLMGMAIAAVGEQIPAPHPSVEIQRGTAAQRAVRPPKVLDLSALWAGPLAGHLLHLAGAEVVKIESKRRPDAMREGDAAFYRLLNQGKAQLALDFTDARDREHLLGLIASVDIVLEAARPRALRQLGIEADRLVADRPGLGWITITGHGAKGQAADWVGFGDDCGVAGGLSAALEAATGRIGFVGDAIADPLTGLWAAVTAWDAWSSGRGGRHALAMSHVVAACIEQDRATLHRDLKAWAGARGQSFPAVDRRTPSTAEARASRC